MEIQKEIKSKIERDYFFIEGTIDLDAKYFINKIEEGIKNSPLNHKTNVRGKMTPWKYFLEDKNFAVILLQIIDCIEELKLVDRSFHIHDVWGLKTEFGEHTQVHDHFPAIISGSIYLNTHSQTLYFPDIKKEIIPQCGKFVIFSSFLDHYTKRNITDEKKYAIAFNFEPNKI
tara:strand:- start:43 stop:561 length:519 start_codon:yes stop_codon:yes gene_type:complete